MFTQILLGAAMIVITTFIQGLFTVYGIERLRDHVRLHPTKSVPRATLQLAALVLWLFLATITEVWSWALLYLALGAFDTLEHAVYFSTVTFTTLGFGDITLDDQWRLLSSFEAANGLLLFGWSTALLFVAVKWVYQSDV
ncbi:potassium channel family protein [Methyloligella solikamskensis]|uniref:Potassium channel family protein n=1 Tax=Methyloligella solikamskensis TaxID=1177756 RepID=A0ABW3J9F5_9HYPH